MVLGHRFTGPEAHGAGLVDRLVEGTVESMVAQARTFAKEVYPKGGYNRQTLHSFKLDAYRHLLGKMDAKL